MQVDSAGSTPHAGAIWRWCNQHIDSAERPVVSPTLSPGFLSRLCRNWKTSAPQKRVGEIPWGFESLQPQLLLVFAVVAKLADVPDRESGALRHAGSTPADRSE